MTYKPESNGQVSPTSQSDQVLESDDITGSTAESRPSTPATRFVGWLDRHSRRRRGQRPRGRRGDRHERHAGRQGSGRQNKAGDVYAHTTYVARFAADETQTYTVTY